MKPNTLAAFYDALAPGPESAVGVLPPPDMGQGMGHFNVFSLAELRGAAPMTFSRRECYRITLCRGRSQVECADRAPHVGANTLFLVTPRVPYRWLPLTEDFTGCSCLFGDAFLLPARTRVMLAELPIFQPRAYPVCEVAEADCAALEAIFQLPKVPKRWLIRRSEMAQKCCQLFSSRRLLGIGVVVHLTHFPHLLAFRTVYARHFHVVAGGAGVASIAGGGRAEGHAARHGSGRYGNANCGRWHPIRRYRPRWQHGLGQGSACDISE